MGIGEEDSMDEFEKIKTFSESLNERQQAIAQSEIPAKDSELDLPQYLSQFQAMPVQEEQKESKRILWIVLILCLLISAGVIFALTKRLPEMEENEIVVISPTPLPVKVQPENPGGLNIPDTDKVVYNRLIETDVTPVVETLFPEPEQPVLPTESIEPENREDVIVEEEPNIELFPPQNIEETPSQEDKKEENDGGVASSASQAADENLKIPAVPPAKDAVFAPAKAVIPEKNVKLQPASNKVVWHAQLLSSASKARVESSWKQISKKHAALLSDMPYKITSATIPGKGTFYRLQVGDFADKTQVENLCAKLKKKKQECMPVK